MKSEIGLLGLGVMGKSLARNLASKDLKVSVYNVPFPGEEKKVEEFVKDYAQSNFYGASDLSHFVHSLDRPRKIILMITAGTAVDDIINEITQYLEPGDVIIDGGNSHYSDTQRRFKSLEAAKIHFVGLGVSGGEEGALKGPSLMPGCSKEAYDLLSPYLTKIAALDRDANACVAHIGIGGAGHFVKMVHNGLEYADMQLIAEAYGFLKYGGGLSNPEIAEIFKSWLSQEVSSYLLEISVEILNHTSNGAHTLDMILDAAGNKGTGKWVVNAALDLGVPIPTISEAVFARFLSAMKDIRQSSDGLYEYGKLNTDQGLVKDLMKSMQVCRIMNYSQGFHLIQAASQEYNWEIHNGNLANIWKAGCIIRSELLYGIGNVFNSGHQGLLFQHDTIKAYLDENKQSIASVINRIAESKSHAPVFNASYQYLLGVMNKQSTANMIQAQRDYFGAHQYERIDQPRGKFFHTNWTKND